MSYGSRCVGVVTSGLCFCVHCQQMLFSVLSRLVIVRSLCERVFVYCLEISAAFTLPQNSSYFSLTVSSQKMQGKEQVLCSTYSPSVNSRDRIIS